MQRNSTNSRTSLIFQFKNVPDFPDVGKVIPQSGGLRKLRWSLSSQGKRGGMRVIYYWSASRDTIVMLFVYAKNEQDDLTRQQLKTLRKIIEEEYR